MRRANAGTTTMRTTKAKTVKMTARATRPARGAAVAAAALAAVAALAAADSSRADVMLSNFEGNLGSGVQGWFDYSGPVTGLGVATPTGGTSNWMYIGYTSGIYADAGPTIQPWANSNLSNANFQANNYLQLDVIFPSSGPNAWLSNETLPVLLNSNGGGAGVQLATVDTSVKDTPIHLSLHYAPHKASNGGAMTITDWMNLLFGHADEAQWGGTTFNPFVYVDNVQLTVNPELPPQPPPANSGTWDATKSGPWSVAGNWIGAVAANGAGNTATFPQADAPRTVNVDAVPIGVGTLTIDSTNGYTIAGNAISIDSGNTTVAGAVNVNAASGDHTISAPLSMARSTTFTVAGSSTLFISNLSGGGFGSVTQLGTGTLSVDKIGNVSLSAEGTVTVRDGAPANSWVYAITTSAGATVNLGNNTFINNGVYGNGTVNIGAGGVLQTANYADYEFFGTIAGAGSVVVGHPDETIGEVHVATWSGGAANTYSGSTTITDGSTLVLNTSVVGTSSVTIDPGATLRMTGGLGTNNVLKTGALGIAGTLDLGDNKLLTDTPIGTATGGVYSGVQGDVQRAYNFGAWDQPGLTTSEENAGPNAGPLSGTTTIGVATAEQILFIAPTDTGVFAGQAVTGATTIAMYTYAGDMNFDGLVDASDYGIIDNSVQFPGTDGYANGDLNYDGIVDASDYGIIDNTIQLQGAPIPTGIPPAAGAAAGAGVSGVTAVPEPSACGFAVLVAVAGATRRRRRRCG